MAKGWNAEVAEEERHERAGLLETDERDLVNRKKPNNLKAHMNSSKREVNMKRMMRPHKEAMAQLQKSHRVELQRHPSPQGGQGACFGVLQSGATLSFPPYPSATGASRVLPRPALASVPPSPAGDGGVTRGGPLRLR